MFNTLVIDEVWLSECYSYNNSQLLTEESLRDKEKLIHLSGLKCPVVQKDIKCLQSNNHVLSSLRFCSLSQTQYKSKHERVKVWWHGTIEENAHIVVIC